MAKKLKSESKSASLMQIIKYCTALDFCYILLGTFGSFLASINWPILTITFGEIVDVYVKYEFWYTNNRTHCNETIQTETRDNFMAEVTRISAMTGGVCITFIVGNLMSLYFFQMFAMRLTKHVKRLYFRSILRQEIAWFDKQHSGEYASRIASDFKKFECAFNENLALLVYNIFSAILHLILGFLYGWKLSLAVLSLAPVIFVTSFGSTKLTTYFSHKEMEKYSEAASAAEEAISAIRTVYAFNGQQKEIERYNSKLIPGMIYGSKRNFATGLGMGFHWATIYSALGLGIWYGVRLIINPNDDYSIGEVVIVFWGITGSAFSIGYAAPFYESFQLGKAAAKSIFDIVERESYIDTSKIDLGVALNNYKTNIEFREVEFSYPTRPHIQILQGLNLKIFSGETVALVGPSGCGKSTTIQLLQRFYDVEEGKILLDNYDIRELNVGWLRGQLGVVGQEPVLFDETIEENIKLGMPLELMNTVTQDDIEEAAKAANAHDFISQLPQGYKTYIGGAQLSGGQKQRIAIARALISKPKILLLDEATSALDLESEQIVQTALDRASKNCTTIIIAHRLSTIINADRIIYLEKGQVLEEGSHTKLMEKKGKYYDLVQAQQVHQSIKKEKPIEKIPVSKHPSLEYRRSHAPSDLSHVAIHLKMSTAVDLNENELNKEDLKKLKKFPHKRLWKLIWIDKYYFCVAFISALIYGMIVPGYALIFGEFVNIFAQSDDPNYQMTKTLFYTLCFLGLSASVLIFCTTQITLFGIVGEKLTKRLRLMAYSAILSQDISFFDNKENTAGALCARLASDAANVQGATGLRISMICQALSLVCFSIGMGFYYNWRLALVSLTLMPIVALASMMSAQANSQQASKDSDTSEKSSKTAIEVMNAIRTVVSLHKEQYFYNKINDTLTEHYRSIRMKCLFKSSMIALSMGAAFFAYTINFYYGGYLISYGLLKSGDFFKIAESAIFGALVVGQSAVLSSDFAKAKLSAMNIFKLIDRSPSSPVNETNIKTEPSLVIQKTRKDRSKGNITFRGVHFSYPTRPDAKILNGLSFSAHQGETVALVGSSGCGKSTSIQLLERFYDSCGGRVYLDDENITKMDVKWLRSQMALVSQEPILFSYSIRDNIAYGDNSREVTDEEIIRAAKMANAHEFISKFKDGYNTNVGSKGTQLSGGQKQRIAIARGLIRDPPVLLLDEATSALDTASEQIVQNALDEASKDRTCLVIAHRLKTIVNADKIVVIHKGENVEEGTHEELLERRGYYWKLYNNAVH